MIPEPEEPGLLHTILLGGPAHGQRIAVASQFKNIFVATPAGLVEYRQHRLLWEREILLGFFYAGLNADQCNDLALEALTP